MAVPFWADLGQSLHLNVSHFRSTYLPSSQALCEILKSESPEIGKSLHCHQMSGNSMMSEALLFNYLQVQIAEEKRLVHLMPLPMFFLERQ